MDYGYGPTGPIGSAVQWLQGALLGTVASTVAVLAVAYVGFLMLTGRIEIRRAIQVILGCFILFGASTIAQGLMNTAQGLGYDQGDGVPVAAAAPLQPNYPNKPIPPYDPYAGAAIAPRP